MDFTKSGFLRENFVIKYIFRTFAADLKVNVFVFDYTKKTPRCDSEAFFVIIEQVQALRCLSTI